MNEPAKTMAFFGVAILIGAIAWISAPGASSVDESEVFHEKIFPDFTDSTKVGGLEVVSLNDDQVELESFRVELKKGVWTIPSHSGYPADAEDQVVKAAGTLIDLSIVKVVSKNKSSETYRRYGVMEPKVQNLLQYGSDSIGIHATMKDRKGEPLADLIIGKQVEGKPGLRYARAVGQDRVVTIKMDPEKLSTKFEDWIETDLLKLSSTSDIRRINLKDYSVSITQQNLLGIVEGADITLAYDEEKSQWSVEDLKQRPEKSLKMVDAKLLPDEELNEDTLRDLRDSLNDLKIINVDRKPEAFRDSLLREGKVEPIREAALSLQRRGFYLVPVGDEDNPSLAIKSSDGEVYCTMKDGVRYVLRFGDVESIETSSDDTTSDEKKTDGKKSDDKTSGDSADDDADDDADDETKLNRYLFVMVEFDPSIIPVPEYEALPVAKPATAEPVEAKPKDAKPKDAEPKSTEPEKTENQPGENETDDAAATSGEPVSFIQDDTTGDDPPGAKASDDTASDNGSSDDGASDDGAEAEKKPAGDGEAKAAPKADPKTDDAKTKADEAKKKLDAEIDRVKKANESKKAAYDKLIADGEQHVKDLNERFADWYYVISDDVYKKIHLGRDDIVKKKEKAEGDETDSDSETKILPPNFDPAPIDAPVQGNKNPAASTPDDPKADSPAKGDEQ